MAHVDSWFTLQYTEDGNQLFAPTTTHPTAFADVACSPWLGGCVLEDSAPAAGVTVTEVGPGQYDVHLPGIVAGVGTANVTSWYAAGGSGRCKIRWWNPAGVRVNCFDGTGAAAERGTFVVGYVA